jgi:hypothetical protein
MDPTDVAFIKGAVAFALLAATGLSAYWLRLRARLQAQRELPPLDAVHDDMAQLRASLDARLLEVEERLDFAERRLIQESREVREEHPRALTPV